MNKPVEEICFLNGQLGIWTLKQSHESKSLSQANQIWGNQMFSKNEVDMRSRRAKLKCGRSFWTLERIKWYRQSEADRWRACKYKGLDFKYKLQGII